MRLEDVVNGKVQFRAIIDEIACEAARIIDVLRRHTSSTVDLSQPLIGAARARRTRQAKTGNGKPAAEGDARHAPRSDPRYNGLNVANRTGARRRTSQDPTATSPAKQQDHL